MNIKKRRLENILEALNELASAECQDRLWVKGLGPGVSSYVEAVCVLFDDLRFEDMISSSEWSTAEVDLFKEFVEDFDKFNDGITSTTHPSDIVNNPAWGRIRTIAAKVRDTIARHLD